MKIRIYILVIVSVVLSSCAFNEGKTKSSKLTYSIETYIYNDSIVIIPSPKETTFLPNGMSGGIIEGRKGPDKIESNLIGQYKAYVNALLSGDFENIKHYLFKDAITYTRKLYPNISEKEILKEWFADINNTDIILQYRNQGIKVEHVVPSFIRKTQQDSSIFIVFNSTINIYSDKVYSYFDEFEEILAVSIDNGKNWEFMDINDDTPNILRVNYSNDIITSVLGY